MTVPEHNEKVSLTESGHVYIHRATDSRVVFVLCQSEPCQTSSPGSHTQRQSSQKVSFSCLTSESGGVLSMTNRFKSHFLELSDKRASICSSFSHLCKVGRGYVSHTDVLMESQ